VSLVSEPVTGILIVSLLSMASVVDALLLLAVHDDPFSVSLVKVPSVALGAAVALTVNVMVALSSTT
jgi:hypothetical protein